MAMELDDEQNRGHKQFVRSPSRMLLFSFAISCAVVVLISTLPLWSEPAISVLDDNVESVYSSSSTEYAPGQGNSTKSLVDEMLSEPIEKVVMHDHHQHHHGFVDKPIPNDVLDEDWPPLENLIGDKEANITGDVQFLLDFAIVAHPKTATTFTMKWLADHNEIAMYKQELHSLRKGKPAEFVSLLYDLPAGRYYKRGYKNPGDIRNERPLDALSRYFPKTKLIVGLRHPVLWFESFYNFRVHQNFTMPPAETLIGRLKKGMNSVSTDEAKFHLHLDNLGKTDRSSEEEQKLLSWGNSRRPKRRKMKNPVFLFEISQLSDANQTRANQYRSDLKEFLGLQNDLRPIDPTPHQSKSVHYEPAINICDDHKYATLRVELMKNSVEASTWIRTYFLLSPDVTISSPEYFNALLESWMVDPCNSRGGRHR